MNTRRLFLKRLVGVAAIAAAAPQIITKAAEPPKPNLNEIFRLCYKIKQQRELECSLTRATIHRFTRQDFEFYGH